MDDHLLREILWLTTLGGSCVGIVVGLRRHRPSHQHPWWLLFGALTLLFLGGLLTFPLWTTSATRILADLLATVAFPLIGVAAIALARLQAPGGDRESAVDGAIVMVAMATLLAGTVFSADRLADDVTTVSRVLTTIVAPLVMAAVVAAVLRLLFVGSVRNASSWFFVAAATFSMVGRTFRAYWTAEGVYEPGIASDRLQQALAVQQRTRDPLTVMFLDLDGFKQINDRHGHRAGDLVLMTVAERLGSTVRASDTVGRLAGDEFVVIGERTDLEAASHVADRLMEAITEPVDLGSTSVEVGVSIGIVVAVGGMLDAEHLLARADHAMYTAKARAGSARAVVEISHDDAHDDRGPPPAELTTR